MSEVFNRISNLSFYPFYDPSKKMIMIHFFDNSDSKADVVAFLKKDMSWDVREIVGEDSVLEDDCENIIIKHKKIGVFPKQSQFDVFVRKSISSFVEKAKEKDNDEDIIYGFDLMLNILKQNDYRIIDN